MTGIPQIDPAITADEVGIETARYAGLVLRSAFQLIFRREGNALVAVAAEGFLRPFQSGIPLPPRPFLDSLGIGGRTDVEWLGTTLHARNHRHVDAEGLDHVLTAGEGVTATLRADEICRRVRQLLDVAELDAEKLIFSIRVQNDPSETYAALAGALGSLGGRIAIGGLADGQPPLSIVRALRPAIVRIDGGWFRRVCSEVAALRLLVHLVNGFHDDGALVLVEGIETPRQLAAALDAGADLFQGFLLSKPALVGTAIERTTLELGDLLGKQASIIKLSEIRRDPLGGGKH